MSSLPDHSPPRRFYPERIGDREYSLPEAMLDVNKDVTLWAKNPRLLPYTAGGKFASEEELEAALRQTNGYEGLRSSIADIGQLEPIYVWKGPGMTKYLVLEGATRVTCLRDQLLRSKDEERRQRFRFVRAKVLPEDFDERQRAILLARIHVRGDAVRTWGRYIEAKFVYDHTKGDPPVMSASDLARWLGKSLSWVTRLRDAYEFAEKFVEYVDTDDAPQQAVKYFSVLEEISKATGFGPRVKTDEALQGEVFDMVANDVFTEYRDARFMQQFFADPEKWARLKGHETGAAHKLAAEVKAGNTTVRGKIQGLPGQIERVLDREPDALNEDDLEELEKSVTLLASRIAGGIGVLRLRMSEFAKALEEAPLKEIRAVTEDEFERLQEGIVDFRSRWEKLHHSKSGITALQNA